MTADERRARNAEAQRRRRHGLPPLDPLPPYQGPRRTADPSTWSTPHAEWIATHYDRIRAYKTAHQRRQRAIARGADPDSIPSPVLGIQTRRKGRRPKPAPPPPRFRPGPATVRAAAARNPGLLERYLAAGGPS